MSEGYSYNFNTDLSKAKKEEVEAAGLVLKQYPAYRRVEDTLRFNDDNRYDFSFLTENKNRIKFEVKDDDYSFRSENIAIEVKCRGKKSGIAVTEAKFWIHKIRGTFYMFRTKVIKEKIENKEYERFVDNGGDPGSYTNMYLFKQDKFIKWGRPLTGEK